MMHDILRRFKESAVPRSPRNMPTLEAENFSYSLLSGQSIPTLMGTKQGSIEYFSALYADTVLGSSRPIKLREVDPSWPNEVSTSMYGYSLLGKQTWAYSSLDMLVRKLMLDPDTRQACFMILRKTHMLSDAIPCTYGMNFRIRDGKLNVSVHMRSQDLVGSMCSDICFARIVQDMVVTALPVGPLGPLTAGTVHFAVDSAHVYEKDFDILEAPSFGEVTLTQVKST